MPCWYSELHWPGPQVAAALRAPGPGETTGDAATGDRDAIRSRTERTSPAILAERELPAAEHGGRRSTEVSHPSHREGGLRSWKSISTLFLSMNVRALDPPGIEAWEASALAFRSLAWAWASEWEGLQRHQRLLLSSLGLLESLCLNPISLASFIRIYRFARTYSGKVLGQVRTPARTDRSVPSKRARPLR